jgi:hypothetical protein
MAPLERGGSAIANTEKYKVTCKNPFLPLLPNYWNSSYNPGGDIPSFLSGFSSKRMLQYRVVTDVTVPDYLQLSNEDVRKQKHKLNDKVRLLINEQISKEICNEAVNN